MPRFWERLRGRLFSGVPQPPVQHRDPPHTVPANTGPGSSPQTRKALPENAGFPCTYAATAVYGDAVAQEQFFDPALKQFSRAFRLGEPAFPDAETGERWRAVRWRVMHHLLRTISGSPWSEHVVLRGSLLLKAWLGDAAREPGDIDWVVVPKSQGMQDRRSRDMLEDLLRRINEHPAAGEATIDTARIRMDDIWTYERVPGRRVVFPWSAPDLPNGAVQMDLVFGEQLLADPVLTEIPGPHGSTSVLAATRELSLAWKLLWLESDCYPQGKDLYDATLLAEQTHLPFQLLDQVLRAGDCGPLEKLEPGFPLAWDVDWESFQREYPWVTGTAREWQERLAVALEPTFAGSP